MLPSAIHPYMDIMFLVFGGAFLAMGLVILTQRERASELALSRILWLLAAFGISHGLLEWTDLWHVLHGDFSGRTLLKPVLLLVSYLFLFEFGRRLLLTSVSRAVLASPAGWLLGAWVYAPLLAVIVLAAMASDQPLVAAGILSRYLLGFPSAMLTGVGFIVYFRMRLAPTLSAAELGRVWVASHIAGAAFIAYAFFGGLVVTRMAWWPASVLNQDSFLATLDIPVQAMRALCAVLIAASVGFLLEVFHLEGVRRLRVSLSDSRQTLNELRDLARQNELILGSTAEGIIGMNPDGTVAFVNHAALTMLGYTREELIGALLHPLTHHTRADGSPYPGAECPIHRSLHQHESCQVADDLFWRKDGSSFTVEYLSSPLLDQGRVIGGVVTFQDISARKATDAEIRHDREQQSALRELLEIVLSGEHVETTLARFLERLLSVSWLSLLPKGGIFLTEEDGSGLRLVTSHSLAPEIESLCAHVDYGHCLCGRAAASGVMQFAECVDERHDIHFDGMPDHGHYTTPIISNDVLLGVLVLYLPAGFQREALKEQFISSVNGILAAYLAREKVSRELAVHRENLEATVAARTAELSRSELRTRSILRT